LHRRLSVFRLDGHQYSNPMGRLSALIFQLALAALVGYWGARYAQTHPDDQAPRAAAPTEQRQKSDNAATAPAPPPLPAPRTPTAPVTVQTAAAALSVSYRSAVEQAAPSVVTVHSARSVARGPLGIGGRNILSQGLGSGVLLNESGYVVTNNHVVQDATELEVTLHDGSSRQTKLVGVDPDTDLALLKIDASGLRPVTMGNIKELAVGDVVLAVGNPLGVGQTVTQGIVSAVGRKGLGINPIENFIQTDAAINPGNSGGALIDTAGRLVGINTAILSRGGGSEGIGFAIPIDVAQKVVESLQKNGRVARGYLGVSTSAPRSGKGALIVEIQRDGPADRAGLKQRDVIVRLGERVIEEPGDLASATMELEPGAKVQVERLRDGRSASVQVELGRRPPLRAAVRPGR
jgi:serine protease DegQ